MTLTFVNKAKSKIPRQFLCQWVKNVETELLKRKTAFKKSHVGLELVLAFVSRSEMKKVNKKFRQKNKPTDVLSFNGIMPDQLGELLLCYDVIKEQAKDHKVSVKEELGYMTLHGILHLLGYDHEKSAKQAQKMYKLQDSIFHRLSIKK